MANQKTKSFVVKAILNTLLLSRKKTALPKKKGEAAMGITINELDRGEPRGEFEVYIYRGQSKSWQVDLVTESGKIEMETSRGTVKMWKILDSAMKDVFAHCGRAKAIHLKYEDCELKFER